MQTVQHAAKYRGIYQTISCIPAGKVATYGQIAKMAGYPRHARLVGYALKIMDKHSVLPWYRVVNHKGQVRCHRREAQIQRLACEGVLVVDGRVDLKHYLWMR